MKKSRAIAIAIRKEEALLHALLAPLHAIGQFMYGNEKRTRISFLVAGLLLMIGMGLQLNENDLQSNGLLACR